jgi:hypothetical protein
MKPQPIAQKTREPMQKSIRFFMRIFVEFFARVRPVSTKANPACMKNTRAPVMTNQIISIEAARLSNDASAWIPKTTQRHRTPTKVFFLNFIASS